MSRSQPDSQPHRRPGSPRIREIQRSGTIAAAQKCHQNGKTAAVYILELDAKGLSVRKIAKALNALGIRSVRNRPWSASSVHSLLTRYRNMRPVDLRAIAEEVADLRMIAEKEWQEESASPAVKDGLKAGAPSRCEPRAVSGKIVSGNFPCASGDRGEAAPVD